MSGWELEPAIRSCMVGIYKWAATTDRDNFDDFTALNANFLYSNLLCLLLCTSTTFFYYVIGYGLRSSMSLSLL
jgi:hypothetical protein